MGPAASAAFDGLRRRFVAGLEARWAEVAAAPHAQARAAALHRLAGAAGGYGFAALDAAARGALAQTEACAGSRAEAGALDALREAINAAVHEVATPQSDDSSTPGLRSNAGFGVP